MKAFTFYAFLFLSLSHFPVQAQSGTWTWMHGTTANNPLGNFGTQGVPAPTNDPPGMYEPAGWTDLNGNFWLFAGYSANNLQTALWKFDPVTNMWTWMKGPSAYLQPGVYGTMGVSDPANYPGSRAYGVVTWTDSQNNLWLFGGHGYDGFGFSGDLNDLWKYNIATNEWTWMNGSNAANPAGSYGTIQIPAASNQPPPRCSYSGWIDQNGDLWMFGGFKFNNNVCYSDMWRYTVATNTWTWMSGSDTTNAPVSYGIQKQADPSNTPGGRTSYSYWKDSDNTFWLFGGFRDSNHSYSDMWRYDPATNLWTWISGSSALNDVHTLDPACISGMSYPLTRSDNCANWKDACGRFHNYGGVYAIGQQYFYWDDVWAYDPGTDLYTFENGTQLANQTANYGTQLIPAATNHPGGNCGGVGFQDLQGNFWYFGGDEPVYNIQLKNVLWKYEADTNCVKYLNGYYTSVPDTVCLGSSAFFNVTLDHPQFNYYWDLGVPSDPDAHSTQASATYNYGSAGTYSVTLWYSPQFGNCLAPDRDTFLVTVIDPVTLNAFPNVFTPNGDGIDETFPGFTEPVDGYHLQLFNRWGKLIYESTDSSAGWDGRSEAGECSEGVYFWIANILDCKGKTVEEKGFVQLIR